MSFEKVTADCADVADVADKEVNLMSRAMPRWVIREIRGSNFDVFNLSQNVPWQSSNLIGEAVWIHLHKSGDLTRAIRDKNGDGFERMGKTQDV